jgi:hypothetical protein
MGVNWNGYRSESSRSEGAVSPHLAGLQRGSGLRSLCSAGCPVHSECQGRRQAGSNPHRARTELKTPSEFTVCKAQN